MKKILIVIIIAVVVIVAAFFILLNQPGPKMSKAEQDAALTNLLGRKPNLTGSASSPKQYIQFNGKYVSFVYPTDAKPFDDQNKPAGAYFDKTALESFTFSLQSPFMWVSVSVSPVPSGMTRLEDNPAIRVRQLDPGTYKQSAITIDGNKGLQYDKPSSFAGTEKEAFFSVNNKFYMVLVSGSNQDNVVSLYNKILSSLKFL
jgi:hypothetical protein